MPETLLLPILVGFVAQLIDGALGMAYGVSATAALLLLPVACAPAGQVAFTPIAGPRVAFDKEQRDFGKVPFNKLLEHTFRVTNVGSEPVILDRVFIRVVEGCCPPEPVVGSTTLKPGESTTIKIAFSMHEGMGGPHLFAVHVQSNDPTRPEAVVTVRALYDK